MQRHSHLSFHPTFALLLLHALSLSLNDIRIFRREESSTINKDDDKFVLIRILHHDKKMYHKAVYVTIIFQSSYGWGLLRLLLDSQPDFISRTSVSDSGTIFYGSGNLHKSGNCIIKELLVAFAEIAFPAGLSITATHPVFYTAAAADIEVSANKTSVTKIFLAPCKGLLLAAGDEFLERRFENVAQSPLRLDKKLTAKSIAGVLDNDKTGALLAVCANRVIA